MAATKQKLYQFLIPILYLAVLAVVVFFAWNGQNAVRRGQNSSPLYRNLMGNPAFIRRGFNPRELTALPPVGAAAASPWAGFITAPPLVRNSALPDLPAGSFFPFRSRAAEEFTIIIPVEMESQRLDMLNHYRIAFESGRSVDREYFERFTALIESFGEEFRSLPHSGSPQNEWAAGAIRLWEKLT